LRRRSGRWPGSLTLGQSIRRQHGNHNAHQQESCPCFLNEFESAFVLHLILPFGSEDRNAVFGFVDVRKLKACQKGAFYLLSSFNRLSAWLDNAEPFEKKNANSFLRIFRWRW
jgi:hypothetical protein